MWCPQCGSEYRPGFTECADCRVALVTEMPTVAPESDNEPVVYDLTDWPPDRQAKLGLVMRGAGIPLVWSEDGVLSVPKDRERQMDQLIDEFDDELVDAATPAVPPPPPAASPTQILTPPALHRCDALCPFGLTLGNESGLELEVSWTARQGGEVVFVPLDEVLAAHVGAEGALITEHAVTLAEAARMAEAMAAEVSADEPYADLGARTTIENLADFAGELASWCLARDATDAGSLAWTAADAVMRAVVAMSALTELVDSGSPDE